jgi:hypothetical protein
MLLTVEIISDSVIFLLLLETSFSLIFLICFKLFSSVKDLFLLLFSDLRTFLTIFHSISSFSGKRVTELSFDQSIDK